MNNYFCPDCGYQSYDEKEQICPHCNQKMAELNYKDELMANEEDTYSEKTLKEVGGDDDFEDISDKKDPKDEDKI